MSRARWFARCAYLRRRGRCDGMHPVFLAKTTLRSRNRYTEARARVVIPICRIFSYKHRRGKNRWRERIVRPDNHVILTVGSLAFVSQKTERTAKRLTGPSRKRAESYEIRAFSDAIPTRDCLSVQLLPRCIPVIMSCYRNHGATSRVTIVTEGIPFAKEFRII